MVEGAAAVSVVASGMKKLRKFVQDLLGITDLEGRVKTLEAQMAFIQDLVAKVIGTLGKYKDRTDDELNHMKVQIEAMLQSVDDFMEKTEKACEETPLDAGLSPERMAACLAQAKALRTRLRLNRTLIEKHLNN